MGLFKDQGICKYLCTDASNAELETLVVHHFADCAAALPHIKTAYLAWTGMNTADRHAVLGKFYGLYAGLSGANQRKHKTLIFCALFIHEFAAVLAGAMQWPD
jgi:hypothetical protein